MLSRNSRRGAGPCHKSQSSHSGTGAGLPTPIDARLLVYHDFAYWTLPIVPECTSSIAAFTFGHERRWFPTCTTRLYFDAARINISFSAGLWLVGFSRYTCLPACIAIMAAGACQWSGVAMHTASNSSDSSILRISFSPLGVLPVICFTAAWHLANALESTSQMYVTSHSGNLAKHWAMARPREFTPIIPIRIFSFAPTILLYEFAENADVTPPTEMAVAPAKACFRKSFLVNIVLSGLVVFFCKVSKNMVAHSICHTFWWVFLLLSRRRT